MNQYSNRGCKHACKKQRTLAGDTPDTLIDWCGAENRPCQDYIEGCYFTLYRQSLQPSLQEETNTACNASVLLTLVKIRKPDYVIFKCEETDTYAEFNYAILECIDNLCIESAYKYLGCSFLIDFEDYTNNFQQTISKEDLVDEPIQVSSTNELEALSKRKLSKEYYDITERALYSIYDKKGYVEVEFSELCANEVLGLNILDGNIRLKTTSAVLVPIGIGKTWKPSLLGKKAKYHPDTILKFLI